MLQTGIGYFMTCISYFGEFKNMEVHFLLDTILELALNMDTKYKIKTVKAKKLSEAL